LTPDQANSFKHFSSLNDKNIDFEKCTFEFIKLLDDIREDAGVPIIVTRTYSTPEHSVAVGGFATDEHTFIPTEVADILCKRPAGTWDSHKAYLYVKSALKLGMQRIGINFKNKSIHFGMNKNFQQEVLFIE